MELFFLSLKRKQTQSHSTMKKRKTKNSKNKRIKLIFLLIFIGLLPVLYGLYLCTPELKASISTAISTNTSQESPFIEYQQLEIPACSDNRPAQIIQHTGYTVSYNKEWHLPNWVGYELTREETKGNATRTNRFIADPYITSPTATNSDYTHTGFDKGHMAPAADMKWNSTAMKESFFFSNICPQVPDLNRRKWKDLENKARDWAIADSAIIIICGPIVDRVHQTIGKSKITVPQRFFKVILAPYLPTPKAIGFIFPNACSVNPLRTYAVTVDSVEKVTGMDFFSPLPDELENMIEAQIDTTVWDL